jgi:hypothetical protein
MKFEVPPRQEALRELILRNERLIREGKPIPGAPDSVNKHVRSGSGAGREEVSDLRRAVISAEAGEQRVALLRLVHEYERRGFDPESIVLLLLQLKIQNFDERRPWRSGDFRSLLHRPGVVVPDALPGELDEGDIGEPVRSEGVSTAQKHANILALIRLRASIAAHEAVEAESQPAVLSLTSLPLCDDLVMPRPLVRWVVEDIATAGAQVTLPSSRKTGKTTFLLNLCRSAGNGTPFLDRFECSLDGNIGYLNAEMLRADILGYCDRLGNGIWTSRVHMLHCRETGLRLNLLSDNVCDSLVQWCSLYDIEWLILDPWKNFLTWSGVGMNDNDGVLALSEACRRLSVAAKLQLVIIPMHTTQTPAEDGYERGKGAGELEDGADWLWRYTRAGAASDPRVFSVEGRGPGVDEMVVDWDAGTGLLSYGTGTRSEVRRSSGADAAVEALSILLLGRSDSRVMSSDLTDAMKGSSVGSRTDILAAVRAARAAGTIIATKEGRTTWLSLG